MTHLGELKLSSVQKEKSFFFFVFYLKSNDNHFWFGGKGELRLGPKRKLRLGFVYKPNRLSKLCPQTVCDPAPFPFIRWRHVSERTQREMISFKHMERKCLHNIDLLLEIMLEGNTYTSGITKLNEYTFLPGLMVTEPYKKKHFMLPVCSSVFITAIIYLSAQKLYWDNTNHLPFYLEE